MLAVMQGGNTGFDGAARALLSILLAVAIAAGAAFAPPVLAQEAPPPEPSGPEMTIATREAPPFVIKGAEGAWKGIAINLWSQVAEDRGYRYRFEEADLAGMVEGVASGQYDASVGALTITPLREQRVDFSHPYYATGFGIATRQAAPGWLSLIGSFFTWDFLQAVALLSLLLFIVGVLFWLFERKANSEEFPEDAKGIGSGFWFSAVTMTTVGYGDKAPRTVGGKIVALIWMFAAIIIISTFTGMIASSLTAGQLQGAIGGMDDLPGKTVGSIRDSAADEWLAMEGIAFTPYPDVESGLEALADEKIDAFIYDAPLLQYHVATGFGDDLRVLPDSVGRQDYGIALPAGSEMREEINVSMLRIMESEEWQNMLKRELDGGDNKSGE